MSTRKCRIDKNGHEIPVWGNARRLRVMGRQHARRVFELGQPGPLPYGNVEYDRAARAEFDRLTNLKKKV